MDMLISLSILEYEPDLLENVERLERSEAFAKIMRLIETGGVGCIHIDLMRPPMIPSRSKFPTELIRELYARLIKRICLSIHLMTNEPLKILEEMNDFIARVDRQKITVIIQVEAFGSEEEIVRSIEVIKNYGYRVGVSLNLPTPEDRLTERIANAVDIILVMTVPMGLGGQRYHGEATGRIKRISGRFPDRLIEVDGGINPETIVEAWRAGAKAAVVGSYVTLSSDPVRALLALNESLKSQTGG